MAVEEIKQKSFSVVWILVLLIIVGVTIVIINMRKEPAEETYATKEKKSVVNISCEGNNVRVQEILTIKIENIREDTKLIASNPSIIKIQDNKITGIAEGKTTIYALSDDGKSNEIEIICEGRLAKIPLGMPDIEIHVGEEKQIDLGTEDGNITWSSSKEDIVTVEKGLLQGISKGECKILAYNEDETIKKTYKIIVKPANVGYDETSGKYIITNVPYINQDVIGYPTGCEAVSATMVAQHAGYNVSVETIINNTPTDELGKRQETRQIEKQVINEITGETKTITTTETVWVAENPFKYFVGYPTKRREEGSYGCYAEPIAISLIKSGIPCENISGCSVENLYKHIENGRPVVIWCKAGGKDLPEGVTWQYPDGSGEYLELVGEHCAVLIGYDNEYVYLNDPAMGKSVKQNKEKFESNWYKLHSQALIIK